jgi:hypothetical protein
MKKNGLYGIQYDNGDLFIGRLSFKSDTMAVLTKGRHIYPHMDRPLKVTFTTQIKETRQFLLHRTFYDLEKISQNAKTAQESMEKRALNTLFKLIVDENFKW